MNGKKRGSFYTLYILILFSLFLVTLELFLTHFDKSLCPSESCEVASLISPIPKNTMLKLGIFFFLSLFLITIIYSKTQGTLFRNLLLFFTGFGLFADTIFVFRLLFEFKVLCYFCIAIAILILLSFISILIIIKKEPLAISSLISFSLSALLGLTFAYYLTSNDYSKIINSTSKGIIIYSEDCIRCQELLKNPLYTTWEKVHVSKVYSLLKALHLNTLPIIIEKRENQILINSNPLSNATCEVQSQGGLCVLP
ncbi:MAG: hypothetical protein RMI63_01825 [Caldimicrobium sp.]|nr:hypothetical protein [Caldimicrobium sp.]MDW8093745.1 hypothetical protein [Caldimicrobium sp.]